MGLIDEKAELLADVDRPRARAREVSALTFDITDNVTKRLVHALAGMGLTQRDIAQTLRTSKSVVNRHMKFPLIVDGGSESEIGSTLSDVLEAAAWGDPKRLRAAYAAATGDEYGCPRCGKSYAESDWDRSNYCGMCRFPLAATTWFAFTPTATAPPEGLQLLTRASRLGAEAARSEMVEPSFGTNSTTMHHPGDGTGRLTLEAYRSRGVLAAAGVALAYLTAFNCALADGGRKASAQTLSRGMVHALPPDTTDDEKREIVEAIASVGD